MPMEIHETNRSPLARLKLKGGKTVPNSNYCAMFSVTPEMPDISVWSYGYTYLAQKSCRDMGLWDCLQETFGSQTDEIVAVALFMIRKGNAADGIDDWQEQNLIPGLRKSLTSQSCSKLFESFNAQKLHCFFKKWVKRL
jgi:hypothetical protein